MSQGIVIVEKDIRLMPYNPDSKIYYRPLEAALRWCNLSEHEEHILTEAAKSPAFQPWSCFAKWPCLQVNNEKILDAIHNGELRYGCMGTTVTAGSCVESHYLTVRHTDLKNWMSDYYPDQKPSFLFDAIERKTHSRITLSAFQVIKAEHDSLLRKIESQCAECQFKNSTIADISLESGIISGASRVPSERSEKTNLNIIGSLLNLLLGKSPSGIPYSNFETQTAVISSLLAHHTGRLGITQRTLERKFAAARQSLGAGRTPLPPIR
ncbi:hypothetical protein [Pseudomonas sp. B392_1p]|uniref:hypothetical protein n=1 Tax=Pseudomonas sp. B392_1p TaxID=3457507 RepID=UPI003FD4B722